MEGSEAEKFASTLSMLAHRGLEDGCALIDYEHRIQEDSEVVRSLSDSDKSGGPGLTPCRSRSARTIHT
jgi:hypothetical protein